MGWLEDCALGITNATCYNTEKTGRNVITGLVINTVIGVLCYIGFVVFRGSFQVYYARLELPQVKRKPPQLRLGGHWQLWSWLLPVFGVRDAELLRSAGLDALMSMRVVRFGIFMFAPMTFLGIAVLLPVNYTANYYRVDLLNSTSNGTDILTSKFMRMTMSNVPPHSSLLWLHFAFVYIFVAWTCQLLVQYSKEFVALRQVYAIQGTQEAAKGLPSSRQLSVSSVASANDRPRIGSHASVSKSGAHKSEASGQQQQSCIGTHNRSDSNDEGEALRKRFGESGNSKQLDVGASDGDVVSGTQVLGAAAGHGAEDIVQLGNQRLNWSEDSYAPLGPRASAEGLIVHLEVSEALGAAQVTAQEAAVSEVLGQPRQGQQAARAAETGHASLHEAVIAGIQKRSSTSWDRCGSYASQRSRSSVGGGRAASVVSWSADIDSVAPTVAAAGQEEEQAEGDAEKENEEHDLHAARYTVLVLDESMQRFRLGHGVRGGFLRTALPSFKIRRVDPKSEKASLLDEIADKAWLHRRQKSEQLESHRNQMWAEFNYRMNVAGQTFSTLFSDDLGSIVPIYPTKEVDSLQAKLFFKEARRDRLLLELGQLEQQLAAATSGSLQNEPLRGQPEDQQDLATGRPHGNSVAVEGEQLGQPQSAAERKQEEDEGDVVHAALVQQSACSSEAAAVSTAPPSLVLASKLSELSIVMESFRDLEKQGQQDKEHPEVHATRCSCLPLCCSCHSRAERLEQRVKSLGRTLRKAEEDVGATRKEVECKRREVLEGPPCRSFFVTFKSQQTAMLAAQINANPMQERLFQVLPAPEPENVNWPTLERGWWSRSLRPGFVFVFILFIMLFPIGAFSGIGSQLAVAICPTNQATNGLSATDTWFCSADTFATLFRNVVTSYVPSLLLAVYQAVVLPIYFYTCAQAEAQYVSLSALDLRCGILFFYWNMFNLFLGALLGGSVAGAIQYLIQGDAGHFFQILGAAIPGSSNFFINYVIFRALGMVAFQLFWPCGAVLPYILRWLHILSWAKTPKDKAMECPPRSRRLSRDVGINLMSVVIVSTGYAVVSPLILPFALLFFLLEWAVWRYQTLYVFEPAYDGHGDIWSFAAHRYVGCLTGMVVFTSAMLGVKLAYTQALIMLFTLVPFLYMFDRYLCQRYDAVVLQLPAMTTVGTERVCLDPTLYAPPPLRENATGWHLDWGKAWQYWGVPRYGL